MKNYLVAKRSDTNIKKVLAIVLNLALYLVITSPFLLLLNDVLTK